MLITRLAMLMTRPLTMLSCRRPQKEVLSIYLFKIRGGASSIVGVESAPSLPKPHPFPLAVGREETVSTPKLDGLQNPNP